MQLRGFFAPGRQASTASPDSSTPLDRVYMQGRMSDWQPVCANVGIWFRAAVCSTPLKDEERV